VNNHTRDTLDLLTRERLEQRARDADNERLAREIQRTAQHPRRPPLTLAPNPSRRAGQPRQEA
jgi:hypothetical protein